MLVHPQFDPVAVSVGPLAVRWYGLMYLVGFALCWAAGRYRIARTPGAVWTAKDLDDALFYGILGTIIGGGPGGGLFFKTPPHAVPRRHPSQLYEFALEGVLLFVVLWWFSQRPRPRGAVSGAFLLGYGLLRFLVEFTREPDRFLGLLSLGLSMGQWLSGPMIIAGAAMIVWAYRSSTHEGVNRNL